MRALNHVLTWSCAQGDRNLGREGGQRERGGVMVGGERVRSKSEGMK